MKKYPSKHYKTKKRSRIKIPSSQSKTVKHIGGMYDGTSSENTTPRSPRSTSGTPRRSRLPLLYGIGGVIRKLFIKHGMKRIWKSSIH